MSAVLQCVYLAWRHPHRRIEVIFSDQLTRFPTMNTALYAVKGIEECDESHVDLTRQCIKSPIIMSSVLQFVYHAWRHPRRVNDDPCNLENWCIIEPFEYEKRCFYIGGKKTIDKVLSHT